MVNNQSIIYFDNLSFKHYSFCKMHSTHFLPNTSIKFKTHFDHNLKSKKAKKLKIKDEK